MRRLRIVWTDTGAGIIAVVLCASLFGFARYRASASLEASTEAKPDHVGKLLAVDDASTLGSPGAEVVLIVFTDYQCPFCARFALRLLPIVAKAHLESGRLGVLVMNSPITRIHPLALAAAETAECAGPEGRFWEMHDLLFKNQPSLTAARIESLWAGAGLDASRLTECRSAGEMLAKVRRQTAIAEDFDLNGTPTVVVGRKVDNGRHVRVLERFDGVPAEDVLMTKLAEALETDGVRAPR